ncbi:MAG: YqgE/AlgH family protein [Gammaproteobacteria bacterium]|nr:YqgE/AlgH family protein [Gammaproteobacteria bacterium]MDE2345624.1 YqgE/AlgH family protein [Gammaproteobacteria bacterium]
MTQDFLVNHFLVAMPSLNDPNFHKSVIFICEHNAQSALGIIINKPTSIVLNDIFKQLAITAKDERIARQPVFQGGPVQTERGFVIHEPPGSWESSLILGDCLAVTSSRDVLACMARGQGPQNIFVALGYAGWGAGQLESEMASNSWLSTPANRSIIFETPVEQRWQAAAQLLGVDIALLTEDAGHA